MLYAKMTPFDLVRYVRKLALWIVNARVQRRVKSKNKFRYKKQSPGTLSRGLLPVISLLLSVVRIWSVSFLLVSLEQID